MVRQPGAVLYCRALSELYAIYPEMQNWPVSYHVSWQDKHFSDDQFCYKNDKFLFSVDKYLLSDQLTDTDSTF